MPESYLAVGHKPIANQADQQWQNQGPDVIASFVKVVQPGTETVAINAAVIKHL